MRGPVIYLQTVHEVCCLFYLRNSVQYSVAFQDRVFAPHGYVSLRLCRQLVYAPMYSSTVGEHVLASLFLSLLLSLNIVLKILLPYGPTDSEH